MADHEALLPFHRRAIAKIIDYSSRLVEEQSKLSTRFKKLRKFSWNRAIGPKKTMRPFVDDSHIHKALIRTNASIKSCYRAVSGND